MTFPSSICVWFNESLKKGYQCQKSIWWCAMINACKKSRAYKSIPKTLGSDFGGRYYKKKMKRKKERKTIPYSRVAILVVVFGRNRGIFWKVFKILFHRRVLLAESTCCVVTCSNCDSSSSMGAAEKIWNATEVAETHSSEIPSSSRTIDHSLSLPDMRPRIVSVFRFFLAFLLISLNVLFVAFILDWAELICTFSVSRWRRRFYCIWEILLVCSCFVLGCREVLVFG